MVSVVKITSWDDSIVKHITREDIKYSFILKNIVQETWPALKDTEQTMIADGMTDVINVLMTKYNKDLWGQLIQNNSQDLQAIMYLLLPFIKETGNKKALTSLSELYMKRTTDGDFVYTNSQYNRCRREQTADGVAVEFRPYLKEYFLQNKSLLLASIEQCSNKLYVNWGDILPVTMDKYEQSDLYKGTQTKITQSTSSVNLVNGYQDLSPGLTWQDIYNAISGNLFSGLRKYRWIMFDINLGDRIETYLEYMEKRIDCSKVWQGKTWDQLTLAEAKKFEKEWKDFFDDPSIHTTTLLTKFFYYFVEYHPNAEELEEKGLIKLEDREEGLEEGGKLTPEQTRDARTGLANLPAEEVYNFLLDQFSQFKTSWFYYTTKIKNKTVYATKYIESLNITLSITPKTFYNFAESLTHITIADKYTALPSHWQSLHREYINMFFIRMLDIPNKSDTIYKNDWSGINWFVRNKYFRMMYPGIDEKALPGLNKELYGMIKPLLASVIIESMIFNGVLSQFIPTPAISDGKVIQNEIMTDEDVKITAHKQEMIGKIWLSDKSYEDHAYYWLTGLKYKDGPLVNGKPWFSLISSHRHQDWVFTYAMDWLSQINFFHKFINTRVIYATGSTGVGKSTQIPKLAMYAKHMLYNTRAKVICTQPRIDPTRLNAEIVASQLGVPIFDQDKKQTDNYQVQFEYESDSHSREINSYLRFCTDGKLFVKIKSLPFLTRTSKRGQPEPWMYESRSNNIYDIVIVDEAHEHNANMDLILTLMKNAAYVNNDTKLLIVSATMDDDEPIYRRYYRDINDNRSFPLNMMIGYNSLDRANVDRRVHISPPGKTTRYTITSHYLTKEETDKIGVEGYLRDGIDFTIKLANSTREYDILLFVAKVADVMQAVKEINDATGPDMFAIGFYGELSETQKDVVRKIHEVKPTLVHTKDDILTQTSIKRVQAGTYKRAVIVATNIAEASISISSLRYVVDTGYVNTTSFDPLQNITRAMIVRISNTSSDQRKGRVGRVMSGEVYFRYDKASVAKNKTAYKIADSDVKDIVLDLTQSYEEDAPIISRKNDINNISILKSIRSHGPRSKIDIVDYIGNPMPYLDIIKKQYLIMPFLEDAAMYYTYYGVDNGTASYWQRYHDDYDFSEKYAFRSSSYTGYMSEILMDNNTQFYIIHPDENIITRNMFTGAMIGLSDSDLVSDAYYRYFFIYNGLPLVKDPSKIDYAKTKLPKIMLAYRHLSTDVLAQSYNNGKVNRHVTYPKVPQKWNIKANEYLKGFKYDYIMYIQSIFYKNLRELQKIASYKYITTIQSVMWYTYAITHNLQDDVLAMILLMQDVPSLKRWINEAQKNLDKKINLHVNQQSDIFFVYLLWQDIKKALGLEPINVQKIEADYVAKQDAYKSGQNIGSDQKIFDQMKVSGRINFGDYLKLYGNDRNLTSVDEARLKSVAKANAIDEGILMRFAKKYMYVRFDIVANMLKAGDQESLRWLKARLYMPSIWPNPTDWDIILQQYIRAYSSHLIYSEYDRYIDVATGSTIIETPWSSTIQDEQTFIKHKSMFMLYQTIDVDVDQTVSYLTPIKIEWYVRLNPLSDPNAEVADNKILLITDSRTTLGLLKHIKSLYENMYNPADYNHYRRSLGAKN